jgi:hypothetical protein
MPPESTRAVQLVAASGKRDVKTAANGAYLLKWRLTGNVAAACHSCKMYFTLSVMLETGINTNSQIYLQS